MTNRSDSTHSDSTHGDSTHGKSDSSPSKRTNRRDFLKTSAAGAAVVGGLPIAGEALAETRVAADATVPAAAMEIGFHTDAFNSSYWNFEKCLQVSIDNGA